MSINSKIDKITIYSHNKELQSNENEQIIVISNNYTNRMLHNRSQTNEYVFYDYTYILLKKIR